MGRSTASCRPASTSRPTLAAAPPVCRWGLEPCRSQPRHPPPARQSAHERLARPSRGRGLRLCARPRGRLHPDPDLAQPRAAGRRQPARRPAPAPARGARTRSCASSAGSAALRARSGPPGARSRKAVARSGRPARRKGPILAAVAGTWRGHSATPRATDPAVRPGSARRISRSSSAMSAACKRGHSARTAAGSAIRSSTRNRSPTPGHPRSCHAPPGRRGQHQRSVISPSWRSGRSGGFLSPPAGPLPPGAGGFPGRQPCDRAPRLRNRRPRGDDRLPHSFGGRTHVTRLAAPIGRRGLALTVSLAAPSAPPPPRPSVASPSRRATAPSRSCRPPTPAAGHVWTFDNGEPPGPCSGSPAASGESRVSALAGTIASSSVFNRRHRAVRGRLRPALGGGLGRLSHARGRASDLGDAGHGLPVGGGGVTAPAVPQRLRASARQKRRSVLARGALRSASRRAMRTDVAMFRAAAASSSTDQKAGSRATEVRWPWRVRLRLTRCGGFMRRGPVDGRVGGAAPGGRRSWKSALAGPAEQSAPVPPTCRRLRQYMCWPPLIDRVAPVMNPASSAHRKATPRAISCACPSRPAGIRATIFSSTLAGTAATMSVSI